MRAPVDRRDQWMKIGIGIFLILDAILIFYWVRHCTGARKEEPQIVQPIQEEEPEVQAPLDIAVLNGCGVGGLADKFTTFLIDQGFNVVKTANFEEEEYGRPNFNVMETLILDQRGNRKNCIRLANALGLDPSRIVETKNEELLLDASLVLGKDFRQLPSWKLMENSHE
jgi:hypothetical protein